MMRRRIRKAVRMGDTKVEQLERRQLLSSALDGDVLRIITGAASDRITISVDSGQLKVQENSATSMFDLASVGKISISSGGGHDFVQTIGNLTIAIEADLGSGNDTLSSGSGNDTVYGGLGSDLITSGGGDDLLNGDSGNDRISAGDGNDTVNGGTGNDTLNSGDGTDVVNDDRGRNRVDTGSALLMQPMYMASYQPDAYLSNVTGYDPAQIRRAYGLGDLDGLQMIDWERLPRIAAAYRGGYQLDVDDQVMLETAWSYGYGQTIFIVDAFTGLDVRGDLTRFSQQFDLPLPTATNLRILNMGRHGPAVDGGWAGEINLDLQWAHAMAPAARLVLVQADSNITVDMYRAVKKAADIAQAIGGGVVSMSFGVNIPYDTGVADDLAGLTRADRGLWDAIFRTHNRVSFLAASGDYQDIDLNCWPATSPYVTAVGGTQLWLDQDGNRLGEEGAWFAGGAGFAPFAWYERPSYQQGIFFQPPQDPYDPPYTPITPLENIRAIPDVSLNSDPATPYAFYTSTPDNGDRGWFAGGGTSFATPAWAGIVALANQQRKVSGRGVIGNRLNGTLYDIYKGYAEVGNPDGGYGYSDCFNDIIVGQAGPWLTYPGYDLATGIGTPKVGALIDALSYRGGYDFEIQNDFTFEARFWLPYDSDPTRIGMTPVEVGQARSGTGFLSGTDTVDLTFTTIPNRWLDPGNLSLNDRYYDLEAPDLSDVRVRLYRTGRGQRSGYIYGMGDADIWSTDPVLGFTAAFKLKFDGRWWIGRDGVTHFSIHFSAVDPVTYEPLESNPFALRAKDQLIYPWGGAYYEGEING